MDREKIISEFSTTDYFIILNMIIGLVSTLYFAHLGIKYLIMVIL
jgi:hypothetical protein